MAYGCLYFRSSVRSFARSMLMCKSNEPSIVMHDCVLDVNTRWRRIMTLLRGRVASPPWTSLAGSLRCKKASEQGKFLELRNCVIIFGMISLNCVDTNAFNADHNSEPQSLSALLSLLQSIFDRNWERIPTTIPERLRFDRVAGIVSIRGEVW